MTYTASNASFVNDILKPFFQETGLNVPDVLFNEIVKRICTEDGYTTLNMVNSNDYITQRGLSLLRELQRENYRHM